MRAHAIVAPLGAREQGVSVWNRAAQADGRLKPGDPLLAAAMLHGQVKAVAFWPQVTMGAPPLAPNRQAQVVKAAVSMFLAYFASESPQAQAKQIA